MIPTNKLKAQIHIGKQQLGLDDDTYRALLKSATGKTSSADMNIVDLHKVVEAMKQRGFKVRRPKAGKSTSSRLSNKNGTPADLLDKLKAVWRDMGKDEILRDASDAALRSYVRRQTGGDFEAPEFCDNATLIRLIESLKQWQKRVKKKQQES